MDGKDCVAGRFRAETERADDRAEEHQGPIQAKVIGSRSEECRASKQMPRLWCSHQSTVEVIQLLRRATGQPITPSRRWSDRSSRPRSSRAPVRADAACCSFLGVKAEDGIKRQQQTGGDPGESAKVPLRGSGGQPHGES